MSQQTQQPTSFQPPQQSDTRLSSGKQMPAQSSNQGFNLRQGGSQPEHQGWNKQGFSSSSQQQWQQSGGQQQQQGLQQTQGWQQQQQQGEAPARVSPRAGFGGGGVRAFVKDSSGKHVQDSSIRVRVKGEQAHKPAQQSFQKQQEMPRQPSGELPKVFRDLPPGEILRPLEEIDERAIWATRTQGQRPPESTIPGGESPYQPFIAKPWHKPLKEATVQEQRQQQLQEPLIQHQESWQTKEQWSSGAPQPPKLPGYSLAPKKPTRRVRYPPTSEQLLSQKGKLRYTGLLAAAPQKPLVQEQVFKGEYTRPGVDDARRSSLPPIREEGEMVQMDVSRVNNPERSMRSAGTGSSSNIVLTDAPPQVEAVPLEQQQRQAGKEGFFGKLKHMFSDKKEA